MMDKNIISGLSVIIISLSACTGGTPTTTKGYSKTQQPIFEQLNSNGDKKISLQEFTEGIPFMRRSPEGIFNRLDANNNGYINREELKATQGRRPYK